MIKNLAGGQNPSARLKTAHDANLKRTLHFLFYQDKKGIRRTGSRDENIRGFTQKNGQLIFYVHLTLEP